MKRTFTFYITVLICLNTFGQNTYNGKIIFMPNPCLTEPYLPGEVISLETISHNYVLTINSNWIWSDNNLIVENIEYFIDDEVEITGITTVKQDIYSEKYTELEIQTIKKLTLNYEYVPFPTSNAIWSEVYYFKDDINWQPPAYECFTINGEDTIINAISYKKIYMFFNTEFNKNTASYVGALREDEQKRIWLKMDTPLHLSKPAYCGNAEEILLYDFSVKEGDTIKSEYLNIYEGDGAIVEKIDTIQIGNTYRKKIKIMTDEWIDLEWIEGIGSSHGLFFTPHLATPTGSIARNVLIGFKHQNEILYFDDAYPSFYPTAIRAINSNRMRLIPILRIGLMFEFSDKDNILGIQIFNTSGILQTTLQKEFILNTNSYTPGIYIYKAMNNIGDSYIGKFLVH